MKKLRSLLLILMIALLMAPISINAYSEYLIPGGETVGIRLSTKGILVVGLYKVNDIYPSKEAGIKVGDIITKIMDKEVTAISEMQDILSDTSLTSIKVEFLRNDKTLTVYLTLLKNETGLLKTGLYVKDQVNGVGTLTFIDPETKIFGALGHEIIEKSSGQKIDINSGNIFRTEITGITRSTKGTPGEKNAKFYSKNLFGSVYENTSKGIFGNYDAVLPNKDTLKIANYSDIKIGEAKILTVLQGELIEEFSINILKINDSNSQKNKNLLFEITDERLLNETGGIIQGMSGSPIIQNDKLIGAVTHVVVDDVTKGFGIYIRYMLEEAEN